MEEVRRSHSIIKLHDRDDYCWGVVDARGGLLNLNGLSMRLTRQEAQIVADDRNGVAKMSEPLTSHGPDYTAAYFQKIEAALATCHSCVERQRRLIERLEKEGSETRAAQSLLKVFSEIVAGQEDIRRRVVDYFHTLPDARDNPAFRAIKEARAAALGAQ